MKYTAQDGYVQSENVATYFKVRFIPPKFRNLAAVSHNTWVNSDKNRTHNIFEVVK